jgi:hypothetical protein
MRNDCLLRSLGGLAEAPEAAIYLRTVNLSFAADFS